MLVALGGEVELVGAVDLGLSSIGLRGWRLAYCDMPAVGELENSGSITYQADDARGVLLVTNEEKTLASLGGPGDVRVSSLGRLLALEVVGEGLGLNSLSAEEEELLGRNEVPAGVCG